MLKLKELPRQIVAGLLAAGAFTLAYLGVPLVWWAALLVGVAVYVAALLLIERAPEAYEVTVFANLTQADVQAAVQYCRQAAAELRAASKAKRMDAETAVALEKMAQLLDAIADSYRQDPRDLKHSRSFVQHHLPKIRTAVQDYVALGGLALTEQAQQRLVQVGATIRGYVPHIQSIYDACLENDFAKLELETSVLGDVMRLENQRG